MLAGSSDLYHLRVNAMKNLLGSVIALLIVGWVLPSTGLCSAFGTVIQPELAGRLQQSSPGETLPVIVRLAEPLSVHTLAVPPGVRGTARAQARATLVRALRARAEASQLPLRDLLRKRGLPAPKDLWLINGLAFPATPALIEELAQRPEVASVDLDAVIQVPRVVTAADTDRNLIEDNIDLVDAPALWASGFTGQGVTVAIVDSGVDSQHADLGPRWRGGTDSWFNAVAANCGNSQVTCATSCDTDTTQPCDYLDTQGVAHGTAVAGVLVGGSATGTAIGVAPGVKWIAAKIFDSNDSAPLSLIHQAFAWLLDPDGNPATDDAPDVVNNSWGFESSAGQCSTEFQADVQALRDAGIAVVFAAGNIDPGPAGPGSSISPANNSNAFAVGSVGTGSPSSIDFSQVSTFSSRGPSACDGTIFPEVVAPGYFVKTADLSSAAVPNAYRTISGTSFAAPHAAGVMALLLSAFPGTPVAELESALMQSAVDLGTAGPDNDYGYGRIDALTAYTFLNAAPAIEVTDSRAPTTDGILAFGHISPGTTASGTVRIRNAGAAALALGSIDFSGVAAPFAVTADPCSNTVLNPDQACTLSISFAPAVLGEFSGSFAIPSNDPDQPQVTVALSGFGNTPPLAPQPQSPANGATVSDPVTFTWLPASDADGDAVTQALVVSPHPDFSVADTIPVDSVPPVTPLALGAGGLLLGVLGLTLAQGRRRWVLLLLAGGLLLAPVACGGGGGGGTPPPNTQSATLSGFTSGVTYYWKMTATDSRGAVTESAARTFTDR